MRNDRMTEFQNDRKERGSSLLTACKNLAILFSLFTLSASAAVPLRWTVETSRATPAQFEAYQGETLDLEATLQSSGKPLELSGIAALYWQTNGMGSAYWEASAAVNSNRMSAVWTPEMDVGAKVYNCFIGQPGTIYHAAFQLRLRPSPGALPNVLPLPTPVIDFAKVRVLNPPWEGGGGGGVNTNAVIDIIHKTVDGAARPLPAYLHALDFDDSYPAEAQAYYDQRQGGGDVPAPQCSAVRSGNFLSRNFDYPFDDRAEFVVKMSAGPGRFASVGVANVGTNLTEKMVTSGKWSKWYKSLPGATVDGINENGVACNINVVDGDPQTSGWCTTGNLHPLAAIRWILDNSTNAQQAATYIASHIAFPSGWTQNFHYMIADETATYIVENGSAHAVTNGVPALTNFRLYGDPKDTTGEGQERYVALTNGANITSQWWTLTYTPDGYRASDLPGITGESLTQLFNYWENNPRESHRGESFGGTNWWQSIHTSIYDITNRVLRVAVQEVDEWFTFAVDANGVTEVAWEDVTDKPTAFPPSSHTHPQSQVEGLADTLAAKRGMTDRDWIAKRIKAAYLPITNTPDALYEYDWSSYSFAIGEGSLISLYSANGYRAADFDLSDGMITGDPGVRFNGKTIDELPGTETLYDSVVDTLALTSEVPAPVEVIKQEDVTTTTPDGKAADAKDLKAQLAKKADEFTEWVAAGFPSDYQMQDQPTYQQNYLQWGWLGTKGDGSVCEFVADGTSATDTDLVFKDAESLVSDVTATRKCVLRTGDAATPSQLAGKLDKSGGGVITGKNDPETGVPLPATIELSGAGGGGKITLSTSSMGGDPFIKVESLVYGVKPRIYIGDEEVAKLSDIDHTSTRFSNEVLAVGLNIDTNAVIALNGILADTNVVAVIGEIAGWPVDPTTGATTIGSLLAALAAAVYFLKRKTSLLESDGKASNGFATDLLEKQVAKAAVNDLIEDKIEDSTTSTSTTDALSANMGKELQDQIQNLKQRGRYLSIWNCTTGLAETEPTVNPYPYKAGDYFIVGTVGATNYRPNGAQYDKNTASTTPETATVLTNDTYYYDGTSWSLLHTPMPSVPTEYLKSATATDNSLTVTKQDNTQVSLTVNYEYAVGAFGSSIASGEIRTIAPITLTIPVTLNLGNSATESADCALWVDTSNLSSDVTLSLSSNYNYYGDNGYQTMTKGKHILVTFLRLNATDVIVTKKEY